MYIPPLRAICENAGIDASALHGPAKIAVPATLLKFLIQLAVASGDFNEEGYLHANPDVADALRKGVIDDPRVHYIKFGYFEHRRGATPEVDESWYRRTYKDVGAGISSGLVASAGEHFDAIGCIEGRSPSAAYEVDANEWKSALGKR